MNKLHYSMLWTALTIITLLIVFSIYGAFLGSDGARDFFNCPAIVAYWFALNLVLIAGSIIFRRLLLIHIGCILVLFGAMLGSDAGHRFQHKLLGINRIHKGWMVLYQGQESNEVKTEKDNQIRELPFSIKLEEFKIDYYESKYPKQPQDKSLLKREGAVRNYTSSLAIIENGKIIAEKNVEVNHPLHYGGYHFYQHSYDAQKGQYSILMVVSDSGLALVYAGYVALCVGVIRHFWLRNILREKDAPDGD
jgi:cytochrome c biogenesis protein ResB